MAKTNTRTQRMIGFILSDLMTMTDNWEYHIENNESRWATGSLLEEYIWNDHDFNAALRIVQNMIESQAKQNPNREQGYWLDKVHEV